VSGQQIVEEPFFPILTSSSPILRGLDEGLPRLRGYNGTTAKAAAQTVLVTARDDPLLAQWQYGLGRSVAWTSDTTGRWARDWVGWNGFSRFFSQLVSWTFPGEETGGIEAVFDSRGGKTTLHVESVEADGSPRDFYDTTAVVVGPDFLPSDVSLVQIAPGVYEAEMGEIDPGAYAIRVTQARPGSSPLGRTVGLVAPTAAEYRVLGPNEAFLGALRTATGGSVVETPLDPWRHDLLTTSRSTDLWPLLLVLALLLWPLDIALRRVSVGRREFVAAGAWIRGLPKRRRRTAARTAAGEGLFAARERATSAGVRAAILRQDAPAAAPAEPSEATAATQAVAATPRPATATPTQAPATTKPDAAPTPAPATAPAPASAPATARAAAPAPPAPAAPADTMARLREAKKRAQER
jgi:hypothetical protein